MSELEHGDVFDKVLPDGTFVSRQEQLAAMSDPTTSSETLDHEFETRDDCDVCALSAIPGSAAVAEQTYSPSVAAAFAANPKLAARTTTAKEGGAVPHPASPVARAIAADVFGSAALATAPVLSTPPAPTSYRETFADAQEARDAALRTLSTGLAAPDDAQRSGLPDAIEAALVRVDAIEERTARYREATGRLQRLDPETPAEAVTVKVGTRLFAEIETLARQRGESRSATGRYLLECGLVLADERRKRYEAYMLDGMMRRTVGGTQDMFPDVARTVQQHNLAQLEPQRYVDPQSPSIERALRIVDPLGGAPDEVRVAVPIEDAVSLRAPHGERINVTAQHEIEDENAAPMQPRGPVRMWM
jgi:hypothetical protein